MNIFLLRHGKAARPSQMVPSDYQRSLTISGRRQIEKIGSVIKKMGIRPDILASSPLVRAMQTASIVSGHVKCDVVTWEELKPEIIPEVTTKSVLAAGVDSVMLVGHEPHLSGMVSSMVCDSAVSLSIKKGGLVCVNIMPSGAGIIRYMLTPKQMVMMT